MGISKEEFDLMKKSKGKRVFLRDILILFFENHPESAFGTRELSKRFSKADSVLKTVLYKLESEGKICGEYYKGVQGTPKFWILKKDFSEEENDEDENNGT